MKSAVFVSLVAVVAISAMPASAAPRARAAATPHPGEQVYREVCQACHMANAQGGVGAGRIPALAANPALADADYPIVTITGGRGAMPWFRGTLTDQQIADVTDYIRTHYGNRYKGRVTVADVERVGVAAPPRGER